jgi:hypothetical protein
MTKLIVAFGNFAKARNNEYWVAYYPWNAR